MDILRATSFLYGDCTQEPNSSDIYISTGKVTAEQMIAITAKATELQALEPLRILREQRNILLSQTDWWATTDRTMSNDQQIYRQKLRDLPANTTPSLDSDGQLTNVTWPTKPE